MAQTATLELNYLSYDSYVRLCSIIGIYVGFAASFLFFVLDLLGMNASIHLGFFSLPDIWSGVVVLFVGPFVSWIIAAVGGVFTYRLFVCALKKYSGLSLTGDWLMKKENSTPPDDTTQV